MPQDAHDVRLKALEDRLRTAEKRLRDSVIENLELRERVDVIEGLEESLQMTKKQLKSMEEKLRTAIDENSDLRKRMYKW
jgi:predicted RNase H-like nuclease (RuvC/YqgF family)